MEGAPEQLVTVEPADARGPLRRFAEVPYALHHREARWSAGVRSFEQWRLDARRHPYFDRGDAACFLARLSGRPVGRIAAHVDGERPVRGRFGFFDAPDDETVVRALLDAAVDWLGERGASTMAGPLSWTAEEHFGVLVRGHQLRGVTGCPWDPGWYAERLRAAGGAPGDSWTLHRLSTQDACAPAPRPTGDEPPPHAGAYGDAALVLEGIAAVPDVSDLLAGASLRSAWRTARAARRRDFDTAVCVRCAGDPAALVPGLLTACRDAGYRSLLAPWAPDDRPPERVRQIFTWSW